MSNATGSSAYTAPFIEPIAPQMGYLTSSSENEYFYTVAINALAQGPLASNAVLTGVRLVTLPVVSNVTFTTTLTHEYIVSQAVAGGVQNVTLTLQSSSRSSTSGPSNTSSPKASHATESSKSPEISAGVVAGIAIGTALAGALLMAIVLLAIFRRKDRRRRSKKSHASPNVVAASNKHRKEGTEKVGFLASTNGLDGDRLLPQPLDDGEVKSTIYDLFTQIDGHVENFYVTSHQAKDRVAGTDRTVNDAIHDPATRLFRLKQFISKTILESMDQHCPADRSFLPRGYSVLADQLQPSDLDDQLNTLLWSRFRMSVGLLLKNDIATEGTNLDGPIGSVLQILNAEIEPYGVPSQREQRTHDLVAILRKGAESGRMLAGQPALWGFDWTSQPQSGSRNRAHAPLVYFPALFRYTDNNASRLASPIMVLPAKIVR